LRGITGYEFGGGNGDGSGGERSADGGWFGAERRVEAGEVDAEAGDADGGFDDAGEGDVRETHSVGSVEGGGVGDGRLADFEADAGERRRDGARKGYGEVSGAGRGEAGADEAEVRNLFGAAFDAERGRFGYFGAALGPDRLAGPE
jgi:hypothetical protein